MEEETKLTSAVEESELNPAHPEDENPEDHIGEETPDPWDDPNQTDWPTNKPEEEATI